MIIDPVEILKQLVAIPSVNPMGQGLSDPTHGEARLTVFLEETFARLGLSTQRQSVEPGRENLIARLDGASNPAQGGPVVLLDVHQDTVSVDGMTISPFEPQEREGRIYGRGACDVKGGMAAVLAAISRMAHGGSRPRATIVVACTANEEFRLTGAQCLAECVGKDGWRFPKPDVAIVLEPTGLNVVAAHKSVIRWRCHAQGRAAHSSCPEQGVNAIYDMARVLAVLERYAADLPVTLPIHPLCGPATLSVGTIRGGEAVNIVADRCTIEIDHRLPPDEDMHAARQRLIDHLASEVATALPLQHDEASLAVGSLSDRGNQAWAERLLGTARRIAGECQLTGAPYATDAARYSAVGIPAVVFGPGSIEQAHTVDEWISIAQLRQATEILYRFCVEL